MKKNTTLQSMRLSAIEFQLKALESQAQAIERINAEHNEGIDLGLDPEVANVLNWSRKLVPQVVAIVEKSQCGDRAGVAAVLKTVREQSIYLFERSESFRKHGQGRADLHLKHHLGEDASEPTDAPAAIERAAVSSYAQAGFSCFRAESNQYFTFEWQLNALVHLALEISYFAADEVGLKPTGTKVEGA